MKTTLTASEALATLLEDSLVKNSALKDKQARLLRKLCEDMSSQHPEDPINSESGVPQRPKQN